MISEIEILEDFVVEKLKPAIEKLKFELEALLKKAELTRLNCLAAKVSGTGIGVWGRNTVTNVCFNPFTFGVSSIITGIGLLAVGVGVAGAAVSGGTSLVESAFFQKNDKKNLLIIMKAYQAVKEEWVNKLENSGGVKLPLLVLLKPPMAEKPPSEESIQRWLNLRLFVDIKIQHYDELRAGDHIYCSTKYIKKIYHHGVFLGEINGKQTVVDFGASDIPKNVPVKKTFDEFVARRGILYKRDYMGSDIPVKETLETANKILRSQDWKEYELFENNCEHFATFLKLKICWSSQVDGAQKVGVQMLKGVGKVTRTAVVGIENAKAVVQTAKIAKASVSILPKWMPILGKMGSASARTLGATTVLAPIMSFLDIGTLIHDFTTKPQSIESILGALELAEKEKLLSNQILKYLEMLKILA